tara:strand:+ start:2651 stop:3295 length:645 start_codon:yes stop_codon:yes gene_type:complete
MTSKCLILDYGMGNLKSVSAACEFYNIYSTVSNSKIEISNCSSLILPGVGSFKKAMENLNKLNLLGDIINHVHKKKPLLGICLGMQLLFEESEEFGKTEGLGLMKGKVKKFNLKKIKNQKIPHVGWSPIFKSSQKWEKTILANIREYEKMYFVHSFFVDTDDEGIIASKTNYGGLDFCSSINKENIFATQFHPEKSGKEGLKIYKEFGKIIKKN